MPVFYEWDIEVTDQNGDILEHSHSEKCPRLPTEPCKRLVLVRDAYTPCGDLIVRQWAYVESGKLPERFEEGAAIPKRFFKELSLSQKAA